METLQKGSQGSDVKALQKKLGLAASGTFDDATVKALIAWQKANAIAPANGIATVVTLIRMGLVEAPTPIFPTAPLPPVVTPEIPKEEPPKPVTATPKPSPKPAPVTNATTGAAAALNFKALKGAIPDAVLAQIAGAADKFGINSNLRLAHFLSQCAQESGVFKVVSENLNYSADRLLKIFPRKFTPATAAAYAKNPEKIANLVYANIIGNGPESSGDGYKYRGRGYIQLTGKDNYASFTQEIGEDCIANPDLVASKYPLASAAHYFKARAGLWAACDKGTTDANIKAVTLKINAGALGLQERIGFFRKYWALLSA